jgi:hydroxymethylbilane synthase
MKLRIGSRGSQLALWQANHIAGLLRGQGHAVEIEIIKTTGDRLQEVTFAQVGSKGMFTKEIEEALAAGRVDLAVHSLKDLPTDLPAGFALAAIEAVEFRGNVDTRLRKLGDGQVDAILLAAAGLDRLGRADWLRQRLDPKNFCPAAGQGCLAIETREDDTATREAVSFLEDADTRFAVTAERAALAALGGGCQVPIGVYCHPAAEGEAGGEEVEEIFAVVANPMTGEVVRVYHRAQRIHGSAEALGKLAAQKLIESGAGPLLALASGGVN